MENQVAIIDEAHLNAEDSGFGLVYLLKRRINSSIIKIGYTSRTAESRATNYTDGEWIVHKEYPMPVWLARMTERGAHLKLERFWLDPKLTGGSASEIFTCSIEDADIAIQISYIDQLEKSLRHLGIPSSITKIIIKEFIILFVRIFQCLHYRNFCFRNLFKLISQFTIFHTVCIIY